MNIGYLYQTHGFTNTVTWEKRGADLKGILCNADKHRCGGNHDTDMQMKEVWRTLADTETRAGEEGFYAQGQSQR